MEGKGAYSFDLADADTGGGVASVANPEEDNLIITRLILNVATASTGACTVDAGVAAAATTVSDTLIDGLDVNSAAGVFGNIDDQGTNGQSVVTWDSDEYLTVSKKTGAAAGLVGTGYIEYIRA